MQGGAGRCREIGQLLRHLRVVDGLVELGGELGRLRLDQRQQLLGVGRRLRAALGGGLGAAAPLLVRVRVRVRVLGLGLGLGCSGSP